MLKFLFIVFLLSFIQGCILTDEERAPCVFGYNGNGSFHYTKEHLNSKSCQETTEQKCQSLNEEKSESIGLGISSGYKWLEGKSCGASN